MKFFLIILLLLSLPALAQKKSAALEASPKDLALQLAAPFSNDKDKVRSIFRWITDNIDYKVKAYPVRPGRTTRYTDNLPDSVLAKMPLNEIVAFDVLQRREAICNGYTKLFKTLCDYAGIRCEIITGYARTNINRPGDRFRSNHTWNAVYIDSSWQLLDVTWASGFVSSDGREFIRQYDDYYFLTPPQHFVRDHYPEDLQWTLLTDPPTLREFYNMPFRPTGFIKYNIKSYQPATGVIEAAPGDTVQIVVETADPEKDRHMAAEPNDVPFAADSTQSIFLQPDPGATGKKVTYTFLVTETPPSWVHVLYNRDVILRYRLALRKPGS